MSSPSASARLHEEEEHAHLEKSAALSTCFSSHQARVGLGQPSTRARQGNLMWLRKNQLGAGRHSQGVGVLDVSLKNLERRLAHGAGDHLLRAASGSSDRHSHTPTPPPAGWRQGSLHSHPRPGLCAVVEAGETACTVATVEHGFPSFPQGNRETEMSVRSTERNGASRR